MSLTHHLTGKEPMIAQIVRAAFPGFNGNKIALHITEHPIDVRSEWSGGSREWFVFVRLADMQATPRVPDQSAFNTPIPGADAVPLPPGVVCVEHYVFCGRLKGIRIHVHPRDLNPSMLPPASADVTDDELIVIEYTASRKPSYGGVSNYRLHEAQRDTDITPERWEAAKASLIASGHLNKAGAITPKGRNARKPIPAERKRDRFAYTRD